MKSDTEPYDTLLRALAAAPSITPIRSEVLADRFRLVRKLGEGGFGVVFEADDLRDRCPVAVKVLRHPEAEWLNRFKREFRTLAGLEHRNLIALDELFGANGLWFFSMELIDGSDFVTHVRRPLDVRPLEARHPFDAATLRSALLQLLDALAAIHGEGKVHRDVKPRNVLVTQAGRVVLIDLGMVADVQSKSESTLSGTPAYMAPE